MFTKQRATSLLVKVLAFYNGLLNYGVPLRKVSVLVGYQSVTLNVIDAGIMLQSDVTVGKLNQKSGRAARECVVTATRAATAGEARAVVTLPMNKEAIQTSVQDLLDTLS